MDAHRFVESRKAETELPADDHAIVSRLREAAFQQAFGCRKSSDLAGYLSDDFWLIGDSLAFCVDHPFVAELLQLYRNGRVPGDDAA
jgi:DNA-binding MurR/RpiR family transcriptional regulator